MASTSRGIRSNRAKATSSQSSTSDSESDDDYQQSQSSSQRKGSSKPKSSKSQVPVANISEETLERLINDCVRFFLVADQKKKPIAKTDIRKNVLKEHSKVYNEVIAGTERKLQQVFGYKLVELSKKGTFILINNLECTTEVASSWSSYESAKQGFLYIVLGMIFMNGQVMEEGDLWKTLRKFGLSESQPHELLGDIKKLVTKEFVRQLYLEYNLRQGVEPPEHEFVWGQRAELEVSKLNILDFVCKVYGDGRKPVEWTSQFKDATEQNNHEDIIN